MRTCTAMLTGVHGGTPRTVNIAAFTNVERFLKYNDDTRCYCNVRLKADMSQLNLPHENNN